MFQSFEKLHDPLVQNKILSNITTNKKVVIEHDNEKGNKKVKPIFPLLATKDTFGKDYYLILEELHILYKELQINDEDLENCQAITEMEIEIKMG